MLSDLLLGCRSAATVVPVTGVDSNCAENFSIASTPQALATVVFQCPCCWRPSAPRTSRGMSSRHAGRSITPSSMRLAFESVGDHEPPQRIAALGGEAHRRALEVEPRAQDLRAPVELRRRACGTPACAQDADPVEHGRRRPRDSARCVMLSSMSGCASAIARQRLDRRELADREVRGRQRANRGRCAPSTKPVSACSMRARRSPAIVQPASSRDRQHVRGQSRRRRRADRSGSTSAGRRGRGRPAGVASARPTSPRRAARPRATRAARGRCTDSGHVFADAVEARRRAARCSVIVEAAAARRSRRAAAAPGSSAAASSCASVAW